MTTCDTFELRVWSMVSRMPPKLPTLTVMPMPLRNMFLLLALRQHSVDIMYTKLINNSSDDVRYIINARADRFHCKLDYEVAALARKEYSWMTPSNATFTSIKGANKPAKMSQSAMVLKNGNAMSNVQNLNTR